MIPVILIFIISIIWLINRSLVIAYEKDFLEEGIKWLNERPILLPTVTVFVLPTFTAYLTLNQIPDIIKFALPLITFIIGQFIGKYDKQNDIKNRQVEILSELKRKLSISSEKIETNKFILQIELDGIESPRRGFVEERLQAVEKITEDFSKFDTFLKLTNDKILTIDDLFTLREMTLLIDRFNELIEERREYISKCRELTHNPVDLYFDLLKSTDKELLKNIDCFDKIMNKISKIEIR